MAQIEMRGLQRHFGSNRAVVDFDLHVRSGAFLALLGPSGCGKTTVLRLVAGLERPDAGRIAIGGRVVADEECFVEPEDRGLGMVFQSYALWPHMSVSANVAFGLEVQGLPPAQRRQRVLEALCLVGLEDKAERRPHELSGGQRQRVALARSLAMRPPLILLDEPLANLDAHLRETMQAEFRRIHRQSGTTFVFVTHDQAEAMALADEVAVMDGGRLQQVAPPQEIYQRPANTMVARFIGHGQTIAVDVLAYENGRNKVRRAGASFAVDGQAPAGPGWLCVRRRDLAIGPIGGEGGLCGVVLDRRFAEGRFLITVALSDAPGETVTVEDDAPQEPGVEVGLSVRGGWVLRRAPD